MSHDNELLEKQEHLQEETVDNEEQTFEDIKNNLNENLQEETAEEQSFEEIQSERLYPGQSRRRSNQGELDVYIYKDGDGTLYNLVERLKSIKHDGTLDDLIALNKRLNPNFDVKHLRKGYKIYYRKKMSRTTVKSLVGKHFM